MKKLLRKIRAFVSRTFVTDCPHCHKHFYGFNRYSTHVQIKGTHYRIVCHECTESQGSVK